MAGARGRPGGGAARLPADPRPPVVHGADVRRPHLPHLVLARRGGGSRDGALRRLVGHGPLHRHRRVPDHVRGPVPRREAERADRPRAVAGALLLAGRRPPRRGARPSRGARLRPRGARARAPPVRGRVRADPAAGRLPRDPDGDALDVLRRPRPDPGGAARERPRHRGQRGARLPPHLRQRRFPRDGRHRRGPGHDPLAGGGVPRLPRRHPQARVPARLQDPRRLAPGARARAPARALRSADGPAVLAGDPGVRRVPGDRGTDRHARAGGERDRLQPQHDRVRAHGRPRDRGVLARRAVPRGGPAGGRGARRALGARR